MAEIEGGNRMNGFANKLELKGWAKDPDVKLD